MCAYQSRNFFAAWSVGSCLVYGNSNAASCLTNDAQAKYLKSDGNILPIFGFLEEPFEMQKEPNRWQDRASVDVLQKFYIQTRYYEQLQRAVTLLPSQKRFTTKLCCQNLSLHQRCWKAESFIHSTVEGPKKRAAACKGIDPCNEHQQEKPHGCGNVGFYNTMQLGIFSDIDILCLMFLMTRLPQNGAIVQK